jgi:hypothetical protein
MDAVYLIESVVQLFAGLIKLGRFKDFPSWSQKAKSVFVVIMLLMATIALGSIAAFTTHANIPLIFLGILYGIFLSYPVMKFLGPKIQAALAGFVGGLGMGTLGAKEAAIKSAIQTIASTIGDLETTIRRSLAHSPEPIPWSYIDTAIVYCIWMTLLTAFLIVAANACFEGTHPAEPPKQEGNIQDKK